MVNVKTDLIRSLINEERNNIIIVFHNINNANSSIIELITNFYKKKNNLYTLNLNRISPNYNFIYFISIFNNENNIKGKDFLPSSLIQNSIYFQMDNIDIKLINEIVKYKFNGYEFSSEYEQFSKAYLSVYNYDKNELKESNEMILSLNETDKFIKLRRETYRKLNINIILSFIFIFRYLNHEITNKIKNILKIDFDYYNSSLKFFYDSENINIEILINNKYNYLSLPLFKNLDDNENKYKSITNIEEINKNILSLTGPQRHCLLFLSCCYLSNKPCIIQGETCSGKTHLIHLFSKMLGKNLNVYQMNKDSNVVLINGQSKFEGLNEEEINKIKKLKKELENLINLNNMNIEGDNEINVENMNNLLERINEYISKNKGEEEKIEKVKDIQKQILKIITPINRFKYQKSLLCESLENGGWVLIEQIESASSSLIERLIPLTQENPEIKIIQGTKEIIYKYKNNKFNNNENNNKNIIKNEDNNIIYIHPEFRIFFTYNPDKEDTKLNQALLNNCLIFTLPQNDSLIEYSTQISYGILRKADFDQKSSIELSKRFSNLHQYIKQIVKSNPEDFSGKMQFTGRTINFITNYLIKNISQLNILEKYNIGNILAGTIKIFYWNNFQNRNKLKTFKYDTIKKFKEDIEVKIILEDEEIESNYKELINEIEKLSNYLKNPLNFDLFFSFETFVKNCEIIKFKDIDNILSKLKKIIYLNKSNKKNIPIKNFYLIEKINIIFFILNEIKKEKILFEYNNRTLLEIKDIKIYNKTGKLLFLSKIIERRRLFDPPYIISILNKNNLYELLELINDFINRKEGTFIIFRKMIKVLYDDKELFNIINLIFPFYKIEENKKKRISILWLLLFQKLYENDIAFKIEFLFKGSYQSNYNFNLSKKTLMPIFQFDTKYDDLYLALGSINQYDGNGNKYEELKYKFKDKKGEKEKTSLLFYESINKIIINNIEKPTSSFYKNIFDSYNNFKSIDSHIKQFLKNIYNTKRTYNLDLFYYNNILNDINQHDHNIIGKIIGIIYSFPDKMNNFISKYINNNFIKKLYELIYKKISNLKESDFIGDSNIINIYQIISDETNKLNILFLYIENKDYKKNYDDLALLNKFKKEMKVLEKLGNLIPEMKDIIEEYLNIFKDEILNIELRIAKDNNYINPEIDNSKKEILNEKIKELIKKHNDKKEIISILRILHRKINNTQNIKKELLDKIEETINKINKNIKNKEPNLISNEIPFPKMQTIKYKNENMEINKDIEILKESFILYSYKLHLIKNLREDYKYKEYDKIYIINELNKFKEFKNINIILFNKILNNEQINEKLISKIISTLNANLLIKIKKKL